MASSGYLRTRYEAASYASSDMPSLNVTKPIAWWQTHGGHVSDPYDLLPPVFADLTREEQTEIEDGLGRELQEGGAAMAAYASLQSEDITGETRHAMESTLLRYCELDTLAMAMIVQAWRAWANENGPSKAAD